MSKDLLSVIEQQQKALESVINCINSANNANLRVVLRDGYAALAAGKQALEQTQGEASMDCTPNHNCNGRVVHLPIGEQCDKCGMAGSYD